MLQSKATQPESLAAHLKQIRSNVATFSERNEGDFLLSSHAPGALFYLAHAAALGSFVLFGLGYFVVRVFTDSKPLEYTVAGLAVAGLVYHFFAEKYTKRRQEQSNNKVKVGLGAVIMAHSDCWDENAETPAAGACMLVTDDPALEADPDRLIGLSRQIIQLRETEESAVDPGMRSIRNWLVNDGSHDDGVDSNAPMPVPESFSGGGRMWVVGVAVFRDRMPDEIIDRPCFPVMWDADNPEDMPENMLLDMWWWPEVDRLFYASASEEDGQVRPEAEDEGVA